MLYNPAGHQIEFLIWRKGWVIDEQVEFFYRHVSKVYFRHCGTKLNSCLLQPVRKTEGRAAAAWKKETYIMAASIPHILSSLKLEQI